MENDIVLFMDGNIQLEVLVSRDRELVGLSANQMAVLFDKDETNIRKHINNILKQFILKGYAINEKRSSSTQKNS